MFGNLPTCEVADNAVIDSIRSGKANGYAPSVGEFANYYLDLSTTAHTKCAWNQKILSHYNKL